MLGPPARLQDPGPRLKEKRDQGWVILHPGAREGSRAWVCREVVELGNGLTAAGMWLRVWVEADVWRPETVCGTEANSPS